jgi:hypothetical protein
MLASDLEVPRANEALEMLAPALIFAGEAQRRLTGTSDRRRSFPFCNSHLFFS